MSEEKKKLEKWEKKNWLVLPSDYKRLIAPRSKALARDQLIIDDDKLSIGEFSLEYIDIKNIEKEKNVFLVLYCVDGRKWKLFMEARSVKQTMKSREKVLSILSKKVNHYKEIRRANGIEFIKDLPKLYKEISLDDIASRTGLDRNKLIEIIEKMILTEELNAEIRGNMLKLKKEAEIVTFPTEYTSETRDSEKKEGMLVFVSYATRDADLYKIPEIAHKLETYKEIGEVFYWQEDMHDSIIEYMNDNLKRSDVILLFCSPNALESVPVKKEWMAAEAIQKPIIPIFVKPEHIPTLLSDRLGIEFDTFNFQGNVQEIYELILKKKQN